MIKPAVHRLAPNVWLVTETAKAGGLYQVRYRGHRYTCTCPDHRRPTSSWDTPSGLHLHLPGPLTPASGLPTHPRHTVPVRQQTHQGVNPDGGRYRTASRKEIAALSPSLSLASQT